MIAFGEKVKKIREEQGMTQQILADKLFVTRQAISRWERGARCPDLMTAKKLAVALNVTLDELLSGESISENIEQKPVVTHSVGCMLQNILYAFATIAYFMLCIFSLYSYFRPNEALIGTPAGEITLVTISADTFRLIHFFAVSIGLYLSVKNKLTAKPIGCIMCIPYFTAGLSFLTMYIDTLLNHNGSLGISAWITDFIVPLSLGICVYLFFVSAKPLIPVLLIHSICLLTILYYINGYGNRFLNFTDLGFVITTVHFIGKIGMAILLGYQACVWKQKQICGSIGQ